jgi:hypothetical protein
MDALCNGYASATSLLFRNALIRMITHPAHPATAVMVTAMS